MPVVRIEHAVPSYEAWKRAFDSDPVDRAGSGVRRYEILRQHDDPNYVMIDLEFDSQDAAEAFLRAMERIWGGPAKAVMRNPRARIVTRMEAKDLGKVGTADPERSQPDRRSTETWPWPEDLDALVAAPEHHTLLLENEWVRVLDTRIAAGGRTAVHTHRWPSVYYVISWSGFLRRDAAGEITADGRAPSSMPGPAAALWSPPLPPHSLENVGETEIRLISVELKQAGAQSGT